VRAKSLEATNSRLSQIWTNPIPLSRSNPQQQYLKQDGQTSIISTLAQHAGHAKSDATKFLPAVLAARNLEISASTLLDEHSRRKEYINPS